MTRRHLGLIAKRLQFYLKTDNDFFLVGKNKLFRLMLCIYILIKEIYIYLGYFLKKSKVRHSKFIIFAQGRTGSELLRDLLNSHPQIQCDSEILRFNAFFPKLIIKGRCALSRKDIYGFKVKIYQLTRHQYIQDPKQFMQDLHKQGWKIIHIERRNMLRQAVSRIVGKTTNKWHYTYPSKKALSKLDKIHIDYDDIIAEIKKQEGYLIKEKKVLKDLPYATIVYEEGLLRAEEHQMTLNRIFDFLDLVPVPVKTKLVRSSPDQLKDIIQNYAEVVQAVSRTKYAKFLDSTGNI